MFTEMRPIVVLGRTTLKGKAVVTLESITSKSSETSGKSSLKSIVSVMSEEHDC